MKLGDVLTASQCRKVRNIVNSEKDSLKRVAALKSYLNGYKASLEKKGIVADYLAYAIEFALTKGDFAKYIQKDSK